MQEDIFSEVFDGAVDDFFDPSEPTEEEQLLETEEKTNPSVNLDMEMLLTNGKITQEVELAGHTFVIRTLTIGEELAVSDSCKEYHGTFTETKALATATVAAALETIDGRPLMHHVGPDPTANIRRKFQYIRNKWYWVIIAELYANYTLLLDRQIAAFEELRGK